MKTTLVLPDGLVHAAKAAAAQQGRSLSAWVAEALASALVGAPREGARKRFRLVTFHGKGLQPGVSWSSLGDVEDGETMTQLGITRGRRAAP